VVTKREIVARKYEICQRVLPRYSNKMGPKKTGKKRKNWTKLTVVVDVES